jgi:hypothetical protein
VADVRFALAPRVLARGPLARAGPARLGPRGAAAAISLLAASGTIADSWDEGGVVALHARGVAPSDAATSISVSASALLAFVVRGDDALVLAADLWALSSAPLSDPAPYASGTAARGELAREGASWVLPRRADAPRATVTRNEPPAVEVTFGAGGLTWTLRGLPASDAAASADPDAKPHILTLRSTGAMLTIAENTLRPG